jgi:negative regulator of sigma-B (phosphoserine phosphatase)
MVEIGQFIRPKQGQSVCGDSILVHPFAQILRLAVIDGLGHGPEAEAAALLAKEAISSEEFRGPELIQLCHRKLIGTRGAVVSIVDLDRNNNTWTGISLGNISVSFYGQEQYLPISNGGIAGYSLPSRLISWSRPYSPDQILIMHSDGIAPLVGLGELLAPTGGLSRAHPDDLAESIALEYGTMEDDLSILVAK